MKKRAWKFKYPRILVLIIMILLAYLIFREPPVNSFVSNLGSLSELGIFIAGMLFSFGFTAPFAAGFFITLNPENIFLAGIIGGLGALISDFLIFSFIRISFKREFNQLKKTKPIKFLSFEIEKKFEKKVKIYLLYIFAGILIASPLPDEIGIIMLADLTKIKPYTLAILSFILNTGGIIILLSI